MKIKRRLRPDQAIDVYTYTYTVIHTPLTLLQPVTSGVECNSDSRSFAVHGFKINLMIHPR